MATAAFQRDTAVLIAGKPYVLLRKVSDDLWQLEETKVGRIHEKTDSELRALYASGALEFVIEEKPGNKPPGLLAGKSHREISPAQFEEAKIRRTYALAATKVPVTKATLTKVAQDTWEVLKQPPKVPHWITLSRWRKKFIESGRDIDGIVAKVEQRGNRTRRYPGELLTMIGKTVERVFLTRERKTIQDTLDAVSAEVLRENELRPKELHIPMPSRRLVKAEIDSIPAFDRCMARYGREVATRRFRSMLSHRTTDLPLQRAEIDHTRLDLLVIDDESGLPLGRPVLTCCIDDYTRCILGINIGFEPPSHLTVARCLKNAFMPKVGLREKYPEIVGDWDAHGVMRELSMDNGAEFHSLSLEKACFSLGIEIHYSPRKTPWFKGKIERFQGTLNREVAHIAPGTTFANIFEKEDYDPARHAVVSLGALQQIVRKWIVDVYHQRKHRTLGVPPAQLWKSSVNVEDIQLPESPERLDAIVGRRSERVLTHKGIEFEGLYYNSPDMTTLRMHFGEKLHVDISIDDGDIGTLVVLSPDKTRMFKVPALAQDYANGLTAWQHKVCKRFAAKQMSKYDSSSWLEAKERIAEMIRDELTLKKARRKTHAKAARYNEVKPTDVVVQAPSQTHVDAQTPALVAQLLKSPLEDEGTEQCNALRSPLKFQALHRPRPPAGAEQSI
jgi:putative transposase